MSVVLRGTTRLVAVIGWPVEHSRSPQLLNAAFAATGMDLAMVPLAVEPAAFATAVAGLRAMNVIGASVTVPHKLAAHAACDERSLAARTIGAVNCLHFDEAAIVGHNTDCDGYFDALVAAGFAPAGKRAVILGSGGAARAVAYGLRGLRAVEVVARSACAWAHAWPWTDEDLRAAFARADLVVDCTSVALGSSASERAFVAGLPLDALRLGTWVSTLVYHHRTQLLDRASERGLPTLDGRAMLVHQAARAFTIWTGEPAPVTAMADALDADLASGLAESGTCE